MTDLPTEDIRPLLQRVLAEARPSGVLAVYLFGSHASGRAHRESDVDVAVLLDRARYPTRKARFDARLRLAGSLAGRLRPRAVDLVILNDAPPTLGRRIVTTGKRVACFDEAADQAFVRDVQLRAADLEPFLRRTRRIKLVALAR
jgi:predicted nucleotidyltransferase